MLQRLRCNLARHLLIGMRYQDNDHILEMRFQLIFQHLQQLQQIVPPPQISVPFYYKSHAYSFLLWYRDRSRSLIVELHLLPTRWWRPP